MHVNRFRIGRSRLFVVLFVGALAVLSDPAGASPRAEALEAVDYAPLPGLDWKVSAPEARGLDPALIDKLYANATRVPTVRSVLVVKDGFLIAEAYFHGWSSVQKARLQSVTKSVTSALVGIALDQGSLSSVNQSMMEFFPELAGSIRDPRKNHVTIRDMLQMRAGYPWEESTSELFTMLYHGFRPALLADVPLVRDPGSKFEYSNLTAHLLGVIVARATGTDLKSYAEEHLFSRIGVHMGNWIKDWEGYYNGHADLHLTARDMAKFGQLYLNEGVFEGERVVSAQWVRDSLRTYSENAWSYRVGRNFNDIGYGYLWWSARAGKHRFNFAWGHGGQQIALVKELNMVIVVTADPLFGQHGGGPWKREKENLNLVGDFVNTLPDI